MILLENGLLVVVADTAVETIKRFTRPPETALEAGGILLGRYRGPHIEVTDCTVPLPKDRRTQYGFVRQDLGHQARAESIWQASGHTIGFVGEWHSHPEDHPQPSYADTSTWAAILRKRENRKFIFLIAGRASFYCRLGYRNRFSRLRLVG